MAPGGQDRTIKQAARRSIKPLHEPFLAKARLGPLLVCEAGLLARLILELLPRTGTVTLV